MIVAPGAVWANQVFVLWLWDKYVGQITRGKCTDERADKKRDPMHGQIRTRMRPQSSARYGPADGKPSPEPHARAQTRAMRVEKVE
jgi:hypothetical protein